MSRFAYQTKSLDPLPDEDALDRAGIGVDDALESLTKKTTAALSKAASDYKSLSAQVDKIESKLGRPIGGMPANDNDSLASERKSLADFIRRDIAIKSGTGMSASSDPDGGYGVTPQLSTEIEKRLFNISPIRQICRTVQVGSFDSYQEPMQIGDTGATWVGESEARPNSTTATLGMLDVHVDELYSMQPVTQRLIDDSRFDVAGFVVDRISERFARAEGTAFVVGTGFNQPKGFLSYDTDSAADFTRDHNKLQYVVSGGATTITLDGIKNLFWTLRASHRANGSWVMSSATANALDLLKTGNGDYLYRPSVSVDAPPTLLGRPIYISEDMPAIGAGTYPIAFGNFNSYVVAEKPGVRFLRDPFSSKPNVLFYAYRRVGGGISDTDGIKLLKVSV